MKKKERFTECYQKYVRVVYQYVLSRVEEPETAEDITHHVFCEYFKNMDRISEDLVKAWLLLASKNKIIDEARKNAVRRRILSAKFMRETQIIAEDNTEKIVERMVQDQLSIRILNDLKEKNESWYQIVEEVCVLGHSHEEAAKHLGISKQVLCAKLYRARQYIWKSFGEEYKER